MMVASAPSKTVSAKDEKVNAAIQVIVDMFTSGDLPAKVARTVIRRQAGDSETPCARWSLSNQLLTLLAGTEDARGYRQWEEVGRHVKKGAKAFYILAPKTVGVKVEDPETGEERRESRCVGFLGVPVFRFEDTEGADLPAHDYKPAELPPLVDVAEGWGIPIQWVPFVKDFYGRYQWGAGGERILLCTHDAGTFFHELAHAAHARIRTLRGGQDPVQEMVAETTAAVLCHLYGFPGRIAGSAEYVASYGKDNPGRCVLKVLAEVEQVLAVILEAHEAGRQAA